MEQIQKLQEGVYLKMFPLKGNPLKSINIYVVVSGEDAMIVDTGFNREELQEEMANLIDEMGLRERNTILYLTHLHSDHIGLAEWINKTYNFPIVFSKVDGDLIHIDEEGYSRQWDIVMTSAGKQDLQKYGCDLTSHPGYKFRPRENFPYRPFSPGDALDVGDFHFVGLDFSGHTPGMIGLYEAEKKTLFCGDHILKKITPNITSWGDALENPLGVYLKNLEALKDLNIEHIYSSHRELIDDIDERIEELKAHHGHRLDEVRAALKGEERKSVADVANEMSWDIREEKFDLFADAQKFFAAGEAQAHLEYLRHLGEAEMEEEGGIVYYWAK